MNFQKTLAAPVRIEGIGLHNGEDVRVELLPAAPDSGVVFVRSDLESTPRIPARVENVRQMPRRTALAIGDAEVHTTEHLMAALWGTGVQNVEVRLDACELPGLDGSALPYLDAIRGAGVVDQDAPVRRIAVSAPLGVADEQANIVAMGNGGGLHISYTLDYESPVLATQFRSIAIDEENFARDIAPARTFCLESEAAALRSAGLGRGASPRNTLVVRDDGRVIENELRFADEFVRHKILDLVGDLYLVGAHIDGHIVATKSGHHLNARLAQSLLAQNSVKPARPAPPRAPGAEATPPWGYTGPLDINAVARILPHRYPFLLVDRVIEVSPDGTYARALKNVTYGEDYFQGHFPEHPVMPGVLQIEALAQTAGIMLLSHEQYHGCRAYLLSLDKVKFRRKIVPGDQVVLEARMQLMKMRSAQVEVKASVDGAVASEAVIRFVLVPPVAAESV